MSNRKINDKKSFNNIMNVSEYMNLINDLSGIMKGIVEKAGEELSKITTKEIDSLQKEKDILLTIISSGILSKEEESEKWERIDEINMKIDEKVKEVQLFMKNAIKYTGLVCIGTAGVITSPKGIEVLKKIVPLLH